MNLSRKLLAILAISAGSVSAQTAAELLTVTSISSTLDSSLRIGVPAGTSFVSNPRYAQSLAPTLLGADAARFTDFKLFIARGLAARLATSYANDLKTSFAVSGFMESGSRVVTVKNEKWTRSDLQNDEGRLVVMFTAQRPDGVYLLTALQK